MCVGMERVELVERWWRPEGRGSGMPGGLDTFLWAAGVTGGPELRWASSVHSRTSNCSRMNERVVSPHPAWEDPPGCPHPTAGVLGS